MHWHLKAFFRLFAHEKDKSERYSKIGFSHRASQASIGARARIRLKITYCDVEYSLGQTSFLLVRTFFARNLA